MRYHLGRGMVSTQEVDHLLKGQKGAVSSNGGGAEHCLLEVARPEAKTDQEQSRLGRTSRP